MPVTDARTALIVRLIQRAMADDTTAQGLVAAIGSAVFDDDDGSLRSMVRAEQRMIAGELEAMNELEVT